MMTWNSQRTVAVAAAALVIVTGSRVGRTLADCPATVYDGTITFGGTLRDVPNDMAVGSDGAVALAGFFTGTVDFDPTEGVDEHTAFEDENGDVFVTKFNPDASYAWTRTFGGSGGDTAHGIDFDPDGRIVVTGFFWETVDFDPSEDVDEHTSNGANDAFVTIFRNDGSYEWTRVIGGKEGDGGRRVTVDSEGSILVTGAFTESVDFDPSEQGEDIHEANELADVFVLKLTGDGAYVWAVTFGGPEVDQSTDVAIGVDDEVVVTGWFRNTVDFDPSEEGVDQHTSNGSADIFVSKFNVDGQHQWTATVGGTDLDFATSVAMDTEGNVLVAGTLRESDDGLIDVDPTEGVDERASNGGYDLYLTKLASDGSYLWTWTGGSTDADQCAAVTVDPVGDIFVAGFFGSSGEPPGYSVDFDPNGGDVHETQGEQDVFVSHLLSDGSYRWTESFGGPESDKPTGIGLGLTDEIFITGWFDSPTDFDPTNGTDIHDTNGVEDIFLTTLVCTDELPCEGDANGDGLVDPLDTGFVLARFGCDVGTGDPDCDLADMNGDAQVDPLDVGYILARFGPCQ